MLKLRGDGEDLARILHALIGRLAPRLQTLVLHRNLSWYEEDDDQLSDTLPHNLFDGEVPKLRYLHLECLSPNWSSFFHAPNLSVLKIRLDSSQESQTLPTPDQLLDVLERMPKLTTLEIHCAVPEYPSQPALHERLVNLSRLHVLSFHGDYMHCLSLLRNLSLPVDAFICLRLLPRSISPTPYADIFREVALYLQKSFAHTGPIRRLSITGEGEESNDTYLEFLAIIPSKCHLTYEPRTYFKLMFHLEDDETYSWNTFEMIYDYCLTMPLQAVRQLELLVPELELVRLDYIDMFSPMKNLVFLSICGPSAIELPHVLKTSIASQRRATPDTDSIDPWGAMRVEGPRELMFPKLISLKFSSYNFQDGDGPSFVVGLQRALEHRRSTLGRKPLKRLTFDNCFFADDEWVPKVRECVEKLFYPDNFLDSEYGDEFTVLDDYQESE